MGNMIAYVVACIALASVADATFVLSTAAATTGTVYTVTSASAASLALLGGVAILKGVVLAAAAIPDNSKITTLFNGEVSPVSAKFEFATAAKVGKIVKSAQLCEVRYSCPLSSQEIQKLFN